MKDKKIKKEIERMMKRQWREFYNDIFAMRFRIRLWLAWALITYRKPKAQREKDKIWKQRRKL